MSKLSRRMSARGMTLVELMIVILLLGILTTFAIPTFRDSIANNRVTSATNSLVTALNLARSEAVRRGLPTAVCMSSNGSSCTASGMDWAQGWIAFVDANSDGVLTAADATADTDGSGGLTSNDALLQSWPALGGTLLGKTAPVNTRFARYDVTGMMNGGAAVTIRFGRPGCTGDKVGQTVISVIGYLQSSKADCAANGY